MHAALSPPFTVQVRTVAWLRVLLFVSPHLNTALALTSVGFADYLAGSMLGLAVPMAVWALVMERFLQVI